MSEDKPEGALVPAEIQEVTPDRRGRQLTFEIFDHHPIDDGELLLSREQFVRAAATGLFEFDEVFKDSDPKTNEFQCTRHKYSEWMNAFIRYSSW